MPLVPSISARCSLFVPTHDERAYATAQRGTVFPLTTRAAVVDTKVVKGLGNRARQLSGPQQSQYVQNIVKNRGIDPLTNAAVMSLYGKFSQYPHMVEVLVRLMGKVGCAPAITRERVGFLLQRFAAYSDHPGSNVAEAVAILERNTADPVRQASLLFEFSAFELLEGTRDCEEVVFSDVVNGQEVDVAARLAGQPVWIEAKTDGMLSGRQAQRILSLAREYDALVVCVARFKGDYYAQGRNCASLSDLERNCGEPDASKRQEFFETLNARLLRVHGARIGSHPKRRTGVHYRTVPSSLVDILSPSTGRNRRLTQPAENKAQEEKRLLRLCQHHEREAFKIMRTKLCQQNKDDCGVVNSMMFSGLVNLSTTVRYQVMAEIWNWIAEDNADVRFNLFKEFAVDFVAYVNRTYPKSRQINVCEILNESAFGPRRSQTSA